MVDHRQVVAAHETGHLVAAKRSRARGARARIWAAGRGYRGLGLFWTLLALPPAAGVLWLVERPSLVALSLSLAVAVPVVALLSAVLISVVAPAPDEAPGSER